MDCNYRCYYRYTLTYSSSFLLHGSSVARFVGLGVVSWLESSSSVRTEATAGTGVWNTVILENFEGNLYLIGGAVSNTETRSLLQ